MRRQKVSFRQVDEEVMEMLAELREQERRYTGAILGDAVREYWEATFCEDPDQTPIR